MRLSIRLNKLPANRANRRESDHPAHHGFENRRFAIIRAIRGLHRRRLSIRLNKLPANRANRRESDHPAHHGFENIVSRSFAPFAGSIECASLFDSINCPLIARIGANQTIGITADSKIIVSRSFAGHLYSSATSFLAVRTIRSHSIFG